MLASRGELIGFRAHLCQWNIHVHLPIGHCKGKGKLHAFLLTILRPCTSVVVIARVGIDGQALLVDDIGELKPIGSSGQADSADRLCNQALKTRCEVRRPADRLLLC